MDPICYMLFADDCVLFFEGSENVQTELKVILQWLCEKSLSFKNIVEKISSIFQGWKSLSCFLRQGDQLYSVSCFKAPELECNIINKKMCMFFFFFWGHDNIITHFLTLSLLCGTNSLRIVNHPNSIFFKVFFFLGEEILFKGLEVIWFLYS